MDSDDFFDRYAADLASGDGTRIAANYEIPCLWLSDAGGFPVTDRAELASNFDRASAVYLSQGFGPPVPTITRLDEVTKSLALAFVTWSYRDVQGNSLYDADYIYTLRRDGEASRIACVLSINEQERSAAYRVAREKVDP